MNGNKRKSRPAGTSSLYSRYPSDNRQSKGKLVQAQGVYNNTYFMHAATALVGNLVQVHLKSGNVYEGVFRTFSPNFDIALELPLCIKSNINTFDDGKPVPNCMIFTFDNVVSIIAKEFDPNYATSGAFQTDSAISEKFVSYRDEKELEPWDAPGMNGDIEYELDGGANGWDANEMFIKNEKTFGVQSTFDDSLSDYTVAIEKRETEEFKEAEAKAEKLAQEIEKNPICRERSNLENGDEETFYAAVERPIEQNRDECNILNIKSNANIVRARNQNTSSMSPMNTNQQNQQQQSQQQHSITLTQRSGPNIQDKFSQISKRKTVQTNAKLVRPSITANACANVSQSSSNNTKIQNYQSIQLQGTTSFPINQGFSPLMAGSATFRHQGNVQPTKLNGELSNMSSKNSSQRIARSYPAQGYIEFNTQQSCASTSAANVQENNNSPPLHNNHMGQQPTMQVGSQPPLPQRQGRVRDDVIQELRKFQQDYHLSGMPSQPSKHQMPLNINKNVNMSAHQVQQPLSPPQPQQNVQHISPHNPIQIQNHTQIMQPTSVHHINIKQTDNSNIIQSSKTSQFSHSTQQSQDKSIYQNHSQTTAKQTSPVVSPGINISDSGATTLQTNNATNNNNGTAVNNSFNNSANKNNSELLPTDKPTPKNTITKKTHVLNPSAKPFTPRSPSTPNPSRPHTPQTPVQSISGIYSTGPHVGNNQASFYLMQAQQHTHPNAVQQPRLRRGPVTTSQMHVTAATATGQPLLTAAPLQQFIHYQQTPHPPHFQPPPYQPMMRMFHEPPPQSIQFLTQTPPSTTPSPGQPHQQFHPPPQPSPAGGGPQTTFGATAQPYHVVCPVIHPQLVPNYYHQGTPQNPHQQYQILLPQHPAQ